MRKINIDMVQPGAVLARTVFSSINGTLLEKGIALQESYINKLKEHRVNDIYIEDDISQGVEVSDIIREQTRNEAQAIARKMMTDHCFAKTLEVEKVKVIVNRIIEELLDNDDIVFNLADMRNIDDYTFQHSVNVCILSLVTGMALGFEPQRLRDLGVGAMMHDVGKLCISKEILQKPTQLTVSEFEEVKKHTVYGYELIKKSGKIKLSSAYIAFGHHERYDGSGYPLQLKDRNIQIFARIVAIADVYDALTSDRVYRKKLKPNEVFEYITALGKNLFDPTVIESFVKYVSVYPAGTGVLLNTRERALVINENRAAPTKPVVRIIYDCEANKKSIFKEVDLSRHSGIFIIDSCEF